MLEHIYGRYILPTVTIPDGDFLSGKRGGGFFLPRFRFSLLHLLAKGEGFP